MELEEAAWLIKKVIDGLMAGEIFKETILKGHDPKEFVVFSFGGAGPTHCCGYTFEAGVPKIVTFPTSPVFCALGSAVMDVIQYYETTKYFFLSNLLASAALVPGNTLLIMKDLMKWCTNCKNWQSGTCKGKGISPESAIFSLELEMRYGGQLNMTRVPSPRLFIKDKSDVLAIYENFEREFIKAYSALSVFPEGGVDISSFVLRSMFVSPKLKIPRYPLKGTKAPAEAYKGKREAFWQELGGSDLLIHTI